MDPGGTCTPGTVNTKGAAGTAAATIGTAGTIGLASAACATGVARTTGTVGRTGAAGINVHNSHRTHHKHGKHCRHIRQTKHNRHLKVEGKAQKKAPRPDAHGQNAIMSTHAWRSNAYLSTRLDTRGEKSSVSRRTRRKTGFCLRHARRKRDCV